MIVRDERVLKGSKWKCSGTEGTGVGECRLVPSTFVPYRASMKRREKSSTLQLNRESNTSEHGDEDERLHLYTQGPSSHLVRKVERAGGPKKPCGSQTPHCQLPLHCFYESLQESPILPFCVSLYHSYNLQDSVNLCCQQA